MTIEAKVIADSLSRDGIRLITMQLRYPRFIHAEFMTHRQFSRNASSSRAIPVSKLIMDAQTDPAVPIHWGKNQPGMQAHEQLNDAVREMARQTWLAARDQAVESATAMAELGAHKQLVNRILEPFTHISVVVTATEWTNFFALRNHRDAEPHIRMLAAVMMDEQKTSVPELLDPGDWHLPYVRKDDHDKLWRADPVLIDYDNLARQPTILPALIKLSVARCARVSYLTHDGVEPQIDNDLKLYDRLVGSSPLHASPAEHQATPDVLMEGRLGPYGEWTKQRWMKPHQHGNLRGWIQYRKTLPNECINQ